MCSHTAPFENVTDVLGVNTSENDENNARLSHDELTIVFGRKPKTQFAVTTQYIATRSSPTGAFGTPQPLFAGANQGFDEFSAWLSEDKLTVYWDTTGIDTSYSILKTTRSSTSIQFSRQDWEDVPNVNAFYPAYEPFVVPGVGMYFGSSFGGNSGLYFAPGDGSTFMAAAPITGLNTDAGEELPTPSLDGLALYFYGADREPGGQSADVWLSTRATTSDPFTTSTRDLGMLNTAGYEYPTWISDDNCRLYITAMDGSNIQNIRVATRTP